jgi:small GTP-binding protein
MVGVNGAGKTSLVRRYVETIFSEGYHPTMGVLISKKSVKSADRQIEFVLWDLEGADDREQLQKDYVKHTQAYILVVDVSRASSLDRAVGLQEGMKKLLPTAPFVLALNKSDLPSEISETQLARLDPSWTVVRTSARTGQGVEEIFSLLAGRLQECDRIVEEEPEPGEQPEQEPGEKLKSFLSTDTEFRIESPQPIEVSPGSQIRVSLSLTARRTSEDTVHCEISCRCPLRKNVRCLVQRQSEDRIDAIIEIPDDLPAGDELWCEFKAIGPGLVRSKPIRVVVTE